MISRALGRVVPLRTRLSPFSSTANSDSAILARLKHKDWLTPKEATTLLTSLTHPSSTLSFFHLYTSRKDFDPTEPFCTTLVSKLAQAHHLAPILTLHQTLTLHRPQRRRFSDQFFFTLIKAYAHAFCRVDHALRTLHDMPSFHCAPSPRTFNFVLNLLVVTRLYDAAHDLLLRAPRLGAVPDACSLNILIKGLCARGELNAAFAVLEEFPRMGCEANARTYATLMKGLCESGRVEEAVGLLERMEGLGVDADVAVFNILIGGLRREGRVEEGWGVLEGMVGRGVCPNTGSYNEVLCGLVEGGRFEEAKEVVERMGMEGFVPSFGAYKGLVGGLCEKGLVGEVEWAVRDMVRKGFVPRMGVWRQIVRCLVKREGSSVWVSHAIHAVLED
ncbi:Pentatricopeptide repeat-containing protein, mitochondrial, partial [Mucuna pruriens]